MSWELKQRPDTILSSEGKANVGIYQGAFKEAKVLRPHELSLMGLKQILGHKKWHFAAITTDEVFITCAVADVGYAGNSFVSIVNLKTGEVLRDFSFLGMPGLNVHVNDRPAEGAMASFTQPFSKVSLKRADGTSTYYLYISHKDCEVSASFEAASEASTLAVIGAQKEHKFSFTQKSNLMATKGTLKIANQKWNLDTGLSSLDYSAGIYPHIIHWFWGFGQGRLSDGATVGFNLARGNNLGGQLENVLWLNNKMYKISAAEFSFDKNQLMSPWKMATDDGLLKLDFRPLGLHKEHKDLVIVKSKFAQVTGLYDGTIRDPETGKELQVRNLPGIAEDQFIQW